MFPSDVYASKGMTSCEVIDGHLRQTFSCEAEGLQGESSLPLQPIIVPLDTVRAQIEMLTKAIGPAAMLMIVSDLAHNVLH